jgi:hypothetical protein
MARYVDEPVIVRITDAEPTTFLWRDRIYVVREVLGRWQERRAWWKTQAACAVHGMEDAAVQVGATAQAGALAAAADDVRPLMPGTRVALEYEREVWRVEAGAGRSSGWGIYDLCCASLPGATTDGAMGQPSGTRGGPTDVTGSTWRLLRVAD